MFRSLFFFLILSFKSVQYAITFFSAFCFCLFISDGLEYIWRQIINNIFYDIFANTAQNHLCIFMCSYFDNIIIWFSYFVYLFFCSDIWFCDWNSSLFLGFFTFNYRISFLLVLLLLQIKNLGSSFQLTFFITFSTVKYTKHLLQYIWMQLFVFQSHHK